MPLVCADSDEIDDEYDDDEETPDKSCDFYSYESNEEGDGVDDVGAGGDSRSLSKERSSNGCTSNARKQHLHLDGASTRGQLHQVGRKRKQKDAECSSNSQLAAEVKRIRESKLKHNMNEQMRYLYCNYSSRVIEPQKTMTARVYVIATLVIS